MAKDMDKTPALAILLGSAKKGDANKEPAVVKGDTKKVEEEKGELDMACEAVLSAIAKKSAESLKEALLSFIEAAEMQETDSEEEEE